VNPHLHHFRVFAGSAFRRPLTTALGCTLLVSAGLLARVGQQEAASVIETLGGIGAAMTFGGSMAVFGVIAGALGGPTRDGTRLVGPGQAMPTLPLSPTGRVASEVLGLLAVWIPAVLTLCVLGQLLPSQEKDLAWILHTMSEWVGSHLLAATCLLLPGLAIGRRTSTMGTSGAFGPLLLSVAVTTPLTPVLIANSILLLPASLAAAWLGTLATPRSESGLQGLADRNRLGQPSIKASSSPWHTRTGAILRRAWVAVLPVSFVYAGFLLWLDIDRTNQSDVRLAWILPVVLLAASPAFFPVGLDGRTAQPGRASVPFDGTFAQAWRLLPVRPVDVRRAALRGVAVAVGAVLATLGVILAIATQAGLETGTPTSSALLCGGLVAASPLLTIVSLGTTSQRRRATGVAALLTLATMFHITAFRWMEDVPLASALTPAAVAIGLGMSAWLVAQMARPSGDEV
jgi:hypothetical protein